VVGGWEVRLVEYRLNADKFFLYAEDRNDESTRPAVTETTEPLFTQKEEHHDRE
jgi:hypothetical protein